MNDQQIHSDPRDELAELIAERSPYAGPGGQSSRSIADAIRQRWRLTPISTGGTPCDGEHTDSPLWAPDRQCTMPSATRITSNRHGDHEHEWTVTDTFDRSVIVKNCWCGSTWVAPAQAKAVD